MRYCAFLRGVNVKGTNMKMADVIQVFINVGMKNVICVLASGNIIFSSDKEKDNLKEILENAMSQHFNYQAFLFIKEKIEIESIWENNPFEKDENLHTYIFIGNDDVENILIEEFNQSTKSENEKAEIRNNNFYWQLNKGSTLDSNFGKILGKKNLKDQFTSRNINTFEKILKKI